MILVAVRPENVVLHRHPAPQGAQVADATVVDAIFKGTHISYCVERVPTACKSSPHLPLKARRSPLARGSGCTCRRAASSLWRETMLRINHGLQYLADAARRRRALFSILLLAPVLALLIGFFILPVAQLINLSTFAQQPSLQNPSPPHSLANYANILGDPFYLQITANSILLGFWTTLATLVISYPVAFYITRISGWERTLISVACLLPIFVNVIVGILGWYILLLPYGVIQQILSSLEPGDRIAAVAAHLPGAGRRADV